MVAIDWVDQGKLASAEQMYQRALAGREKALTTLYLRLLENLDMQESMLKNPDM